VPIREGLGQVLKSSLAPQNSRNPVDAKAKAIINAVQDQTREIRNRARLAVWYILYNYYRSEVGKVSAIKYSESEPGLSTTRVGKGKSATGIVTVGRYFIEHTTHRYFARRVLQVGHELKHIDLWRAGMVGDVRKDEREFLAFCWEATAPEPPGTGRINHSTRVALIDAALGYLNCLDKNDRVKYHQGGQKLLELRQKHQSASGRPATRVPASCTRQG
jgi:hypothetical protein